MSKNSNFIIYPFKYNIDLQDNAFKIRLRHIEECLAWSAIIDTPLYDQCLLESDSGIKKTFDVNPEPEQVFDLIDGYDKHQLNKDNKDKEVLTSGIQENNFKITFPTLYKNEKEYLTIALDWHLKIGNEVKTATRFITLVPETISQDVLFVQKLERISEKMIEKITNLETKYEQIHNELPLFDNVDQIEQKFLQNISILREEILSLCSIQIKQTCESFQNSLNDCDTKYEQKINNIQVVDTQSFKADILFACDILIKEALKQNVESVVSDPTTC